ncbi:MAG: FAD-binding domain-containing protein [Pseudomonadota bacterium]
MTAEPRLIADTLQTDWPPTRAEALRRIEAFAPRMGRYGGMRNHDLGPDDRSNISMLSPYLRRRLATEEEAVAAALGRFAPSTVEKFVQEVFWRTYFKGWLEHRPSVWTDYRLGAEQDREAVAANGGWARDLAAAEEGRTGIATFDAWARELVETGYLHNHSRMWFASIWIFTLRLPWRLGARFFLRHLLDADPASNTCSWRWVAGLHTLGKNYTARSSNITKYTGGRFGGVHGLAADPAPLDEGPLPPRGALRAPSRPRFDAPTALLILEDDLRLEEDLPVARAVAVATLPTTHLRDPEGASPAAGAFEAGALQDAAARAEAAGAPAAAPLPDADALIDWAREAGADRIATGFVPTGWARDRLDALAPALAKAGLTLEENLRPWDAETWPHATAGFFKVKQKIPAILRALGHGA